MVGSRRITFISYIAFCLVGLLLLWANTAAALNVQAVADRDRIAAGESLNLQLRLDGSPDGDPDLSALQQSWDVLSQSQSSQIQIINGSFSRSVIYSLTLMPKATGNMMIPAICFAQDCSLPLPITVSAQAQSSGQSNAPLILEAEVSPQRIVSQGELLYRVRLLRRVDLLDGQLNEPQPTGVSAVVKKLGDDRSYETRRGGQRYQVIERNYAIFPQGAGTMRIPALQFDGRIAAGPTRYDPFARQGRRVRRTSQALEVEVLPLPKDLGRRAWIPATALSLQDDWQQQPPQLVVGEPATRTLRLTATGVPAAQLPALQPKVPAAFKSYPDQPKRDDALAVSGITGRLEQKIALVPTRAGNFKLPAIDIDWWDLNANRWRTAHLDALEVDVASAPQAASVPAAPTAPRTTENRTPAPAFPQDTEQPALAQGDKPQPATEAPIVSPGFWPWLSLGLGLGWFLSLVVFWRKGKRSVRSKDTPETLRSQDVKAARQAVIRAARLNDSLTARRALVDLSRALYPETPSPYERLCNEGSETLAAELRQLDEHLYAAPSSEWQGAGLLKALGNGQAEDNNPRRQELPDLYPLK